MFFSGLANYYLHKNTLQKEYTCPFNTDFRIHHLLDDDIDRSISDTADAISMVLIEP